MTCSFSAVVVLPCFSAFQPKGCSPPNLKEKFGQHSLSARKKKFNKLDIHEINISSRIDNSAISRIDHVKFGNKRVAPDRLGNGFAAAKFSTESDRTTQRTLLLLPEEREDLETLYHGTVASDPFSFTLCP